MVETHLLRISVRGSTFQRRSPPEGQLSLTVPSWCFFAFFVFVVVVAEIEVPMYLLRYVFSAHVRVWSPGESLKSLLVDHDDVVLADLTYGNGDS